MKYLKYLFFLTVFLIPGIIWAQAQADYSIFQDVYNINIQALKKPTVVSVTLPSTEDYGVAIVEKETNLAQPWLRIQKYITKDQVTISVLDSSQIIGTVNNLVDNNFKTKTEFDLDKDKGLGYVELQSDKAITSSGLKLYLDDYVALPYNIEVLAEVNNSWKTIVSKTRLNYLSINFPETTASKWKIKFWHEQPLVIQEIQLIQKDETAAKNEVEIRWLARPNMSYVLYAGARIYPAIITTEAGILQGKDLEVLTVESGAAGKNPLFKEPDYDNDGVSNLNDNCVSVANKDQKDVDSNGRGDACEDFDGDKVINSQDNCPNHPNYSQSDEDGDSIGDACDKEESRLTEKNKWLPWVAMGIAMMIVILIVVQTIKRKD